MRNWRSAIKKTCRVRAFILKRGRRASSARVSPQPQEEKDAPKKEEEVKKRAFVS